MILRHYKGVEAQECRYYEPYYLGEFVRGHSHQSRMAVWFRRSNGSWLLVFLSGRGYIVSPESTYSRFMLSAHIYGKPIRIHGLPISGQLLLNILSLTHVHVHAHSFVQVVSGSLRCDVVESRLGLGYAEGVRC